jgi:hypothetical protein
MAHIGHLPPVYRIPPSSPGSGAGESSKAPERKPEWGERDPDQRRKRRQHDDDPSHIDEYV